MIPSPSPEHALESGYGLGTTAAPLSPGSAGGGNGNVRRSLGGVGGAGAVVGQQQPVRQALTHLYEVDREEEVDPS